MKHWLLLFIPLFCLACTDSSTNGDAGPAPVAQDQQTAVPPAPEGGDMKHAQSANIITKVVEYSVDAKPFTGYLAYDESIDGQRPGVLVVHEWWGHNEYARTRAVQLAQMGYTAFALDMYGSGKVADHPKDAQQFMQEAMKDPEQLKQRFLKAKQILEQQATTDVEKIAAIGYCFGGGVVLNMALSGADLDGVASFHGALAATAGTSPEDVKAKILVLHGADDSLIPTEQVEAFKAKMDAADVDYEFITYPGAKHSFTNPGATAVGKQNDMPLAYNEQADQQSWNKLREFLETLWPTE